MQRDSVFSQNSLIDDFNKNIQNDNSSRAERQSEPEHTVIENNDYEPYEPYKQNRFSTLTVEDTERYCCGIFGTKRGCLIVCGSIWFAILLTIGLLSFFLLPRIYLQKMTIEAAGGLTLSDTSPQALANVRADKPFRAEMAVTISITIESKSFVTYSFDEIALVSVRIVNPTDTKSLVRNFEAFTGTGSVDKPVFKVRETSVFKLPAKLTYVTSTPVTSLSADSNIQALATTCAPQQFGLPQKATGTVRLRYDIRFKSTITNLMNFFGIATSYTDDVLFPCTSSISEFLKVVQGSLK